MNMEKKSKINSASMFLSKAMELENHYPLLHAGISRTRTTGWIAWLFETPRSGRCIAQGEGFTADEACLNALDNLEINAELLELAK
ncbi:hypothetical protein [uncultured Microbulbifer sp.]|uniref:hypothetical protein n=1 Tax=uncultured Microbulbifer sp. TaxID=348147 RepID=UPI00261CF236|nr:hypothetical protein [uncultured Microbulbifer sp.]